MTTLTARKGWLDVAEVGSVWGIRFVVGLCSLLGRGPARAFVRLIALYYLVLHRTARRASRTWLTLARGDASFSSMWRHFATFADVTLDRLLFITGKLEGFSIDKNGHEHMEKLAREKKGALLLGAHVGSFEAMAAAARSHQIPVNVVVNFSNAARLQSVLQKLAPEVQARFISIGDGGMDFVLRIRDCLERGEIVAMLADRVGPDGRFMEVDFMGKKARFASGPFIVASALRCPLYVTLGLFHGDNRYELVCEPLAEEVILPRKGRDEALRALVQKYADRIAFHAQRAPFNWFNFFDFWSER